MEYVARERVAHDPIWMLAINHRSWEHEICTPATCPEPLLLLGQHSFNTFFRWEHTLTAGPASLFLLTRHSFIQFLMPQQSFISSFRHLINQSGLETLRYAHHALALFLRFLSPRSRWISLIRSHCGRHTTILLGFSHPFSRHPHAGMLAFIPFNDGSRSGQLVASNGDYGGDTRPAFSEILRHLTLPWGHGILWHLLRINPESDLRLNSARIGSPQCQRLTLDTYIIIPHIHCLTL